MKRLVVIMGYFLVVTSVIFLSVRLAQNINEIPDFQWGVKIALTLTFAVVFYTILFGIAAYMWLILLRGGGVFLNLRKAYTIMGKSQIAKYIPGNFFHYLSQFTLGSRAGIPTEAMLLSMGVHTAIIVLTPATIALTGLLFDKRTLLWLIDEIGIKTFNTYLTIIFISIIILAIILLSLPQPRVWLRQRLAYLHPARIITSVFFILIVYAGFGVIITLLLKTLWQVDTHIQWYQFSWGFALAWVLGFVVPGAPGGIGIREAVFVGLYSQVLGEGLVIGLAIVLRIVTSLGDLLSFGIACWLGRQKYQR